MVQAQDYSINLMMDPVEQKSIDQWLSAAVVMFTDGVVSVRELQLRLEQRSFSENRISLLGEGCYLVALQEESEVRELLNPDLEIGGVLIQGRWSHAQFRQTRTVRVQCHGFPQQGWTTHLIHAFASRLGRLVKVAEANLNRRDCSSLNLLLEIGALEQLPSTVSLHLNGDFSRS